jgi:hypothetical protein
MSDGKNWPSASNESGTFTELVARLGAGVSQRPNNPEATRRAEEVFSQVLTYTQSIASEGNAATTGEQAIKIEVFRRKGRLVSFTLSGSGCDDGTRVWIDGSSICIGTGRSVGLTGGSGWFSFEVDEEGTLRRGKAEIVTALDVARFALGRPYARGCCGH